MLSGSKLLTVKLDVTIMCFWSQKGPVLDWTVGVGCGESMSLLGLKEKMSGGPLQPVFITFMRNLYF